MSKTGIPTKVLRIQELDSDRKLVESEDESGLALVRKVV